MLNSRKRKNRIFFKATALIILQAFLLTNIAYAAPSERSLFKNKKPDYKAIQERRENALQEKKDTLSEKKQAKTTSSSKDQERTLNLASLKDISGIYIPDNLGRVVEVYQAEEKPGQEKKPLVVHIQDLHTNPEGQLNLAGILETLIKDYKLNLVCSEGAEGEVDTSSVSSFPDYEVREKTARLFINSGELTGEEYLSITKYPDLPIWGIEDKDIYFRNIIDFNKIMRFSQGAQVFVQQVKTALDKLKPKIYSKALLEVAAKEEEYEENKIDTAEYLDFLLAYEDRQDEEKYKNINLFKETFELEKKIAQEKIKNESKELLIRLQEALNANKAESDAKTLFTKADLFKDQKISPFSFYSYLEELTLRHVSGDLTKYSNLFGFVDYLRKVNSLDSTRLFREVEELTYDTKDFLSFNEDQKALTKCYRHIKFLENFFNLRISNEDLDRYLSDKEGHRVAFFEAFLKENLRKYNIESTVDFNMDIIDGNLPEIEDFYEIAIKRDKAMFDNTVREIERRGAKIAALITGGFHTRGVMKLLKERGYSYVVIAPFSSTEIDEENYRYLLSGKRKPLSELIDDLNGLLRAPLGYAKDFWIEYEKDNGGLSNLNDNMIATIALQAIHARADIDIKKGKGPVLKNIVDETLRHVTFQKNLKSPIYVHIDSENIYVEYGKASLAIKPDGSIIKVYDDSFEIGDVFIVKPLREAQKSAVAGFVKGTLIITAVLAFVIGGLVISGMSSDMDKEIAKYIRTPIHYEPYSSKTDFKNELKSFTYLEKTEENILDTEQKQLIAGFLNPVRKKSIELGAKISNLEPELIAAFLFEEYSYTHSVNRMRILMENVKAQGDIITVGFGNVSLGHMEEEDVLDMLYLNKEGILPLLEKKDHVKMFNDFIVRYKGLKDNLEKLEGIDYETLYSMTLNTWLEETKDFRRNLLDMVEPINILVASYVIRSQADIIYEKNGESKDLPDVSVMLKNSSLWVVKVYQDIPEALEGRYSIFNSEYYPPYAYQYFVAARYTGVVSNELGKKRSLGKVKLYTYFLLSKLFDEENVKSPVVQLLDSESSYRSNL